MIIYWDVPEPAAVNGSQEQQRRALRDALMVFSQRIGLFISLPLDKLDTLTLTRNLKDIGQK